jgi:signal transduction histidine kinase
MFQIFLLYSLQYFLQNREDRTVESSKGYFPGVPVHTLFSSGAHIYQFFKDHLDIVFFIYGFAFVVMGLVILLNARQKSEFKIATIFWILAIFGLSHGTNELLDMWTIIKGRNDTLDLVRWFILIFSYVFLFEFGRKLFRISGADTSFIRQELAAFLQPWLLPLIGVMILVFGFISEDFWKVGGIWTRYLLGLPGGLLIGFGFRSYFTSEKTLLGPLKVKKYFIIGGYSFLVYGLLGGLVVPKAGFFPASVINTESFFMTLKVPVQAIRAICAITAAWAIAGMMNIFNWEIKSRLQKYQDRLRTLMYRLSIIEENERKRISEEIHDNISQHLALSKIKLAVLRQSNPSLSKEIDEIRELIEQTIKFTRSLTFELSPPVLYELGFKAAIEWLTEQIQEKHGIKARFNSEGSFRTISEEIRVLLFKTIRELLFNIVKHAQAQIASVFIQEDRNHITIKIKDDGIGFNTDTIDSLSYEEGGFGIPNIRERIRYLGGTFAVQSKPGKGSTVEITVPKQKTA